jgi:8-oxo-dGTP pyrophosphatase MutT (NUDIX family)
MRTRCSARIIAINKDKKVLLFKYEDDSIFGSQGPIGKPFWVTPGGGVEDQETYEDAAKRELFEESGLVPVALSKCIWNRIIELTWKGELIQSQEKYYVAYVEEADIKLDNLTLEEREVYRSYKWWSVEEICDSDEIFFPTMLGELLKPIVSGDLPLQPIYID